MYERRQDELRAAHRTIPAVVHDGVQPVCYREDRALFELITDRQLDERVHLEVDGRRRFVEDEDLRLSEQGPREADQLSLADTEADRHCVTTKAGK